jgi:hypothetical protein
MSLTPSALLAAQGVCKKRGRKGKRKRSKEEKEGEKGAEKVEKKVNAKSLDYPKGCSLHHQLSCLRRVYVKEKEGREKEKKEKQGEKEVNASSLLPARLYEKEKQERRATQY